MDFCMADMQKLHTEYWGVSQNPSADTMTELRARLGGENVRQEVHEAVLRNKVVDPVVQKIMLRIPELMQKMQLQLLHDTAGKPAGSHVQLEKAGGVMAPSEKDLLEYGQSEEAQKLALFGQFFTLNPASDYQFGNEVATHKRSMREGIAEIIGGILEEDKVELEYGFRKIGGAAEELMRSFRLLGRSQVPVFGAVPLQEQRAELRGMLEDALAEGLKPAYARISEFRQQKLLDYARSWLDEYHPQEKRSR
jgi:hypothetical protein